MAQKTKDGSKSDYQRSHLYLGIIPLISIVYFIPVLQLVLNESDEMKDTGNYDTCYYNHLCQKPLGPVQDFNHIFSKARPHLAATLIVAPAARAWAAAAGWRART